MSKIKQVLILNAVNPENSLKLDVVNFSGSLLQVLANIRGIIKSNRCFDDSQLGITDGDKIIVIENKDVSSIIHKLVDEHTCLETLDKMHQYFDEIEVEYIIKDSV